MSKEKPYKPKTIAIEIGNVGFDPITQEKIKDIPAEQGMLRSSLIESSNPIFAKIEDVYLSGNELSQQERSMLKEMILIKVEPYLNTTKLSKAETIEEYKQQFEVSGADCGDSDDNSFAHLSFLYNALHNNKLVAEIIDGLNNRYYKMFETDLSRNGFQIVGKDGQVLNEDLIGEIKTELKTNNAKKGLGADNSDIKSEIPGELRNKITMTDEQFQYLSSMYCQRADIGYGVIFTQKEDGKEPMEYSASKNSQSERILNVEEKDGKLVLQGITYKTKAQHMKEKDNGDIDVIDDAIVSQYIDLSGLTRNKIQGSKQLSIPSTDKVTKVITYEPLHAGAEYELPQCLKHRTLDKVLAKAIENGDKDKVNFIAKEIPDIGKHLSKKTMHLYSLYSYDKKSDNELDARNVLLANLIKSYSSGPKKTPLEVANQFAAQMLKYSISKNNADINKENISHPVTSSFLKCREEMYNYLKSPNDRNLLKVSAAVNAMEDKIKLEPSKSRSSSDSSLSSDGDNKDKSSRRFTNKMEKLEKERSSGSLSDDNSERSSESSSKSPKSVSWRGLHQELEKQRQESGVSDNVNLPNLKRSGSQDRLR